MEGNVSFKPCKCSLLREPHGHFYSEGGRCPTETLSIESGMMALRRIATLRNLSAHEMAEAESQLRSADLAERCGTDERVAALFVANFFEK